jgi:hypothetical protein
MACSLEDWKIAYDGVLTHKALETVPVTDTGVTHNDFDFQAVR